MYITTTGVHCMSLLQVFTVEALCSEISEVFKQCDFTTNPEQSVERAVHILRLLLDCSSHKLPAVNRSTNQVGGCVGVHIAVSISSCVSFYLLVYWHSLCSSITGVALVPRTLV